MSHSVQSAVEEVLASSQEDPELVVHSAMLAIVAYARSKDCFRSQRTQMNLSDAISHGEAHFKIEERRKAVETSTLGVLTDALHTAWEDEG